MTDFAPLWLPDDEAVAERHAAVQPADRVDGWTWQSLFLATVLGSRSKTASRVGLMLATLITLVLVPTLARGNAYDLLRLALWQGAVLLAILVATRRVRSVSATTTAVFWLAGLFIAPLLATALDGAIGLIPGVEGDVQRRIRPLIALGAGLAPLLPAVVLWPKRFRHPGMADLLLLGAAVGAGYTLHENGLLDRAGGATLLAGSPMLWIAMLGGVLGLVILERLDEITITIAAFSTIVVVGDATILDLGWVVAIMFVALLGLAISVDRRRLREVARRDHLFPDVPAKRHGALVDRYRRMRAGIHTTIAMHGEHWPPVPGVPVAELARAGRAAGIEVGRESSRNGWDRDPEDRSGLAHRFFGPNGWTTFTVDRNGAGQAPVRARPDAGVRVLEDERRQPISPPLIADRPDNLKWALALGAAAVTGLVGWLTASTDLLDVPTLVSASPGPPMIRTVLGAAAIAAAVVGRSRPSLGEAWELGPPDHHEV